MRFAHSVHTPRFERSPDFDAFSRPSRPRRRPKRRKRLRKSQQTVGDRRGLGSGGGNEQHRRQADWLTSLPGRSASSPLALALGAGPEIPARKDRRAERFPAAARRERARPSQIRSDERSPLLRRAPLRSPASRSSLRPEPLHSRRRHDESLRAKSIGARSPHTKSPPASFLDFCRSLPPDMNGRRARPVIPSCSRACASSVSPWRSCWFWASSHCAFSRREATVTAEAPRADATAAQKRAWTPPPAAKLDVVFDPSASAGQAAPLNFAIADAPEGSTILISGLAPGATLSQGKDRGADWRLGLAELSDLAVIPPKGFVGSMNLVVELRLPDGALGARNLIKLDWAGDATAEAQKPATQASPASAPVETPLAATLTPAAPEAQSVAEQPLARAAAPSQEAAPAQAEAPAGEPVAPSVETARRAPRPASPSSTARWSCRASVVSPGRGKRA